MTELLRKTDFKEILIYLDCLRLRPDWGVDILAWLPSSSCSTGIAWNSLVLHSKQLWKYSPPGYMSEGPL